MSDSPELDRLFSHWAKRVRRRHTARAALFGAAAGAVLSAGVAFAAWHARQGAFRPASLLVASAGAVVGALVAGRRRMSDEQVALYLDGRFGTNEAITTAVAGAPGPAREAIVTAAVEALKTGDPEKVRPPVLSPLHLAVPIGVAGVVWATLLPLPPPPAHAVSPGIEQVQLLDAKGLEKMAELGKLKARDDEQRKRLDKISKDAAALREKLAQGMERREALSELAQLKDAIQAEEKSLGEGERKAGLEAAISKLAEDPLTKDAAKALEDRDLVRFDEEMQKLANLREKGDRERAKKKLEEAAEAAKKKGGADVGKALDGQKDLFDKRAKRGEELRELAKALEDALPPDQRKELAEQHDPKTDADAKKLAKSMEDALSKLTPEERKRLADKLKKQLAEGGGELDPATKRDLERMARDLQSPEGKKQLEEELRKMANEDTKDEEAARQKALEEGERGLGETQKELGVPVPTPGQPGGQDPGGKDGQPGGKDGQPGGKDGQPGKSGKDAQGKDGQPGTPGGPNGPDKGTGDHTGRSKDVPTQDLRSKANAKVNGKAPTAGISVGRTDGRSGETAKTRGTGAIGDVGKAETNGVDKSDVPEEYRDQVGKYFQP